MDTVTKEMALKYCEKKVKANIQRDLPEKVSTAYSIMTDGVERFHGCKAYLAEHGEFPQPIVLEKTPIGFRILDGFHRVCAFMYLYGKRPAKWYYRA